jgi:hypothetical protein
MPKSRPRELLRHNSIINIGGREENEEQSLFLRSFYYRVLEAPALLYGFWNMCVNL